jgi:hypothetical protein
MTTLPFISLEKRDGDLFVTLTPSGRERVAELRVGGKGDREIELDLLEYHLCNGWEEVRSEEVGALTDAMLLTDDAERDDHGNLTAVGRVYWNPDYQVVGDLHLEALERGEVARWRGVE